ncbi:hypothetical protein GCM10007301_31460 [Azorhizobium oxalatiphilum]|uniref:CoxF protein n=1 Tax=Azorhizobium oxalatiphilum TaxID=980631 RepID=A0A917C4D6_9HYPH|nr:hypothetical protein [Azorhizobium oxalatiphilum]GGF69498.1 hypothetical protein GCM10007301_31460 [Azorhizobium oxalatiphilum]
MAQDVHDTVRKDTGTDAGAGKAPHAAPPGVTDGVVLTPEQVRRRRARSVAIASVLGFLVLLFYVVTIVKLGPGVVLNRPL